MSAIALPAPRALDWSVVAKWLPAAFVTFACLTVWLGPPVDNDLGWHLRSGQLILATHEIPRVDPFSHTAEGAPWVDNEWLWEAGLAAVNALAGWRGFVAINALLLALVVALVAGVARLRGVSPLLTAVAAMATLVNLAPYGDVRPGVVGVFCTAALLFALEKHRVTTDWRWLALLPAVQVLWANCHGSYPVGLLLASLYALEAIWRRRHRHRFAGWTALGAALFAATLANPIGLGLVRFTLFASGLAFNRAYVNAWRAPSIKNVALLGLFATLALCAGLLATCAYKRISLPALEMTLLFASALGVLRTLEFLPLFAVVGAPVTAQLIQRVVRRPIGLTLTGPQVAGFALAGLFMASLPVQRLTSENYRQALTKRYPVEAVQYILQHQLPGPLWNDFNWGGYLIYALPGLPVSVDSRTEMYGQRFLAEYEAVATGQEPAEQALDRYRIGLVLVRPESAVSTQLQQDSAWEEPYQDSQAAVFVRGTDAR